MAKKSLCDQPPLMYLDPDTAERRKTNFIDKQHDYLSTLLNRNRKEAISRFFTNDQFKTMLRRATDIKGIKVTGLRIYFASYLEMSDNEPGADDNNAQIPNIYNEADRLTLIFAPTKNVGGPEDEKDVGNYFIVNPDGDVVNLRDIDSDIPFRWIDNYEKKRKKVNGHFQINETKSMWYSISNIIDLADHLDCTNKPIIGVTAYFAVYSEDDKITLPYGDIVINSKNKLTLVFLLQDEDLKDVQFVDFGGGYADTGTPCPPAICP